MPRSRIFDLYSSMVLSTVAAAVPSVVLWGEIDIFHMNAHHAALPGLVVTLLDAVSGFGMPADMAGTTSIVGAAYGLLPISWIVLSVIFLCWLKEETGQFNILRDSIAELPADRRLQLLFIALSFVVCFARAAVSMGRKPARGDETPRRHSNCR